jgi:arylsulfatase
MDIPTTLLSLANLTHPHPSPYNGRSILPMHGKSWTSFLSNPSPNNISDPFAIHGPSHPTGFECAGSGALIRGRWKITYVAKPHGPQRWEMFDILKDPGETRDVSEEFPGEFRELVGLWEEYKKDVGVVGLRGEYEGDSNDALKDQFEDTGKWIRWIGKEDVPDVVQPKFW